MNSKRIEEIQKQTAYPESQSVFTALHQVWNEVGQEYQAEIKQLEARVARLEKAADRMVEYVSSHQIAAFIPSEYFHEIHTVLNEPSQQSLAQIQSDAIHSFVAFMDSEGPWRYREEAIEYARQLRQQADKG